ncbi:MAG TPA: hypothetical protein VNR87_03410 [Flavisolibacter sp.]|nr:hypothetical protein [Flavisolibacter sp.]
MRYVAFWCLLSCASVQVGSQTDLRVQKQGRIKLMDPENKVYAIYANDKTTYFPLKLEDRFKREGLAVYFEGTIDTARMKNVRLSGFPIKLTKIRAQ